MAKVYSTGPAYIHLATSPSATTGAFLGTCENAPDIDIELAFKDVKNDFGGKILPFDLNFQGRQGWVNVPALNRFNWALFNKIVDMPTADGASPGIDGWGEIGTNYAQEGMGLTIFVSFPYNQFPAYADLPRGYRFVCCAVQDRVKVQPGTEDLKTGFVFHAIRIFTPGAASFFTCYDQAVQGLPPPN